MSGSFGSFGIEEARTIVATRKALRLLVRALSHMQGIDGSSVDICRGPTLGAIVTCRGLVLLNWSGSKHGCSIIISFRGTSTVPVVALRLSGSSALCRARFPMMDREHCQAMF